MVYIYPYKKHITILQILTSTHITNKYYKFLYDYIFDLYILYYIILEYIHINKCIHK